MTDRPVPAALRWLAALVALCVAAAAISGAVLYAQNLEQIRTHANAITGGDWKRGKTALRRYGCGGCHVIPRLAGANGQVGPDLTGISSRATLAGKLPNGPAAMRLWLMHPQHIDPGTGMPEQGINEATARDISAYLYAH